MVFIDCEIDVKYPVAGQVKWMMLIKTCNYGSYNQRVRVHIFTRDETGLVCTQLERTLQLCW
jgi:hypothetical protein